MGKIRIGITGQNGFVGTHLFNYLKLFDHVDIVPFERDYFSDEVKMHQFVKDCEVIVHLAGLNRHENPQVIYDTNTALVKSIISACEDQSVTPHIIFSSSTQEESENPYGKSKLEGRLAFEAWATRSRSKVTGLVIPNVFGPFGKPFYNSVIATFCHQLNHNEEPSLNIDKEISLIYVNELIEEIYTIICDKTGLSGRYIVFQTKSITVSQILTILKGFKEEYLEKGIIPHLDDPFIKALFNTFRCYIPVNYYPRPFIIHADARGMFVEVAKTNTSGQTSYSTTHSGVTRGNHFHTRKAERFAVIKGRAKIQLRKIGTSKVIEYTLDGSSPSYVDMPVWYTHNITNIGKEELLTIFWINEPFDSKDPDTYFEAV